MPIPFIITEGLGNSPEIVTEGLGPAPAPPSPNLTLLSLAANPTSIILTFSDPLFLAGAALIPASWVITGGGVPLSVIGISVVGAVITLTINEATIGASYALDIPTMGVFRISDSGPLVPPYIIPFSGAGIAPFIVEIITQNDARTFDVLYSETVVASEALTKENYAVAPLLTPVSVTKVQDNRFQVKTLEAQIPGQVYTVTASNIHDLAGNLI